MNEKVLLVDDDPRLLASCERNFHRAFPLDTAEGGAAALEKLAAHGPYAVVIADRQMPGMDGIELLARVRERWPDTVRMVLTGNADLEVAIQAVNQGNIFRFLTKPCAPEILSKAIDDGRAQYRLITAERELLDKTLNGSIKLLTDILSMMDPVSFGRSQALRETMGEVIKKLNLENAWEIHLAAMLGSIGLVTIPLETLLRYRAGEMLSVVEEQAVAQAPGTAARLLANIPRLENVAHIVRYHQKRYDGTGYPPDAVKGDDIPAGSRLLKIMDDLAGLQADGLSRLRALDEMEERPGWYDRAILSTVRTHYGLAPAPDIRRRAMTVELNRLKPGMVVYSRIETRDGMLILGAGQRINEMILEKIRNFDRISGIRQPIFIETP